MAENVPRKDLKKKLFVSSKMHKKKKFFSSIFQIDEKISKKSLVEIFLKFFWAIFKSEINRINNFKSFIYYLMYQKIMYAY